MAKLTKINHIGIAVNNIEEALPFWTEGLGMKLHHVEEVGGQKSKVAFLPLGESDVELVQPTSPDSTMTKFIAEKGQGIHHLCLETDDIEGMMMHLKEKGIRLINETPLVAEGRKMAFVHPKATGGVLLELYEVTK